jgi:hypothetical protein
MGSRTSAIILASGIRMCACNAAFVDETDVYVLTVFAQADLPRGPPSSLVWHRTATVPSLGKRYVYRGILITSFASAV